MNAADLPLISLIVPVFNVERFVAEALSSMAGQTYRNIEVIVVDDGSSDATASIVEEMCRHDARFRLIRNERNLKIVESLNRGLQVVKGEFIARADGDDVMEPDRLDRQYAYLRDHPDIALVGCSLESIDEQGRRLRRMDYPSNPHLLGFLLKFWTPVSHIWMARRAVYEAVGEYRIPTVEDYDFLLMAHNRGFLLDNIPGYVGARIRVRTDNTAGRYGVVQRILFNYAKSLNSKGREVSHDPAYVEQVIRFSSETWLGRLHRFSDQLSFRAAMSRRLPLRVLYMIAAALVSPYKMQYYKNALVWRICLILWNRSSR